jgi:hypothetical protein
MALRAHCGGHRELEPGYSRTGTDSDHVGAAVLGRDKSEAERSAAIYDRHATSDARNAAIELLDYGRLSGRSGRKLERDIYQFLLLNTDRFRKIARCERLAITELNSGSYAGGRLAKCAPL